MAILGTTEAPTSVVSFFWDIATGKNIKKFKPLRTIIDHAKKINDFSSKLITNKNKYLSEFETV